MAAQRTAVVLGGGVGGLVAANRLRQWLPKDSRVVLIDRQPYHVFQPSLLWVAVGRRRAERIQRPLTRLQRKGIEVIQAEISTIDPVERRVTANGQTLVGDALIVALGAELAPETIPGLAEAGYNLYTVAGADALAARLATFSSGRIVIVTAAPAYKCPAAPYEAAMLIEDLFRRRGIRSQVELLFYAAEPGPMGAAGPDVSAAVRQLIESKAVRYYPSHQITAADPKGRTLSFANGATTSYDVLVYVPPHRVPAVLNTAGLTGESGWIEPDRLRFTSRFPNVYAIGDATMVPLAMGKPLPKAGVFAHSEAEVVAANLAAEWSGRPADRRFDGHGECFVETGSGRAGFGAGNFYAEPTPEVRLHAPRRWWHWSKVWFERQWLRKWL